MLHRRAVELVRPLKKTARIPDVQQVVKDMQNSPTAAFLRELSFHERVMLVAIIKCVRKEGVEEIRWGDVSVLRISRRLREPNLTQR